MVSLAKRRGFVFPSAEIYGGFASTYDYGPLGVEMKRNIRELWWRRMVQERSDVVGLEAAIITNPAVWQASGHVDSFSDPLVDCLECHSRVRADHIEDETCPVCGTVGRFTDERQFNLLFRTFVGPVQEEAATAYLRPETAQGMFVNFDNVLQSTRRRLPFGIAQIGKSFRNEITTGHFTFRMLEFEQMEMEYFCDPEGSLEQYAYWKQERLAWYRSLGIRPDRLRLRDHAAEELSHYSSATADIEYLYPWGWGELEGIAHRGDFDLSAHAAASGKTLSYFDPEREVHIVPHVVEPAAGGGPHPADAAGGRLRRGGRRARREARAAAAGAGRGAGDGGGAAAVAQRAAGGRRRARSGTCCARTSGPSTTMRSRSGVATAARTRSARRCA